MAGILRYNRAGAIAVLAALAGFALALVFAHTEAGASSAVASSITGGQTLTDGATLQSPDGHYTAQLSSGILSDRITEGRTLWQTGYSSAGAYGVLQANGMLVIFAANGQVLSDSGATGKGCPVLTMQLDGNLVDYDTAAIYSAQSTLHGMAPGDDLAPGWSIYPSGDAYRLLMQTDGNLVLYNDSNKAIWSTGTSGNPGAYARMRGNGDLVVIGTNGKDVWLSHTENNDGASLSVQADGNLVVYSTAGKALWSSGSTGKAGTGSVFPVTAAVASATPCPSTVAPPTTTVVQTQTQTVTSTQTVVVPTTTVLTVAAPAPTRLRRFDVKVATRWSYRGNRTFLQAITVGRLPTGVELTVTYDPHLKGHRATERHAVRGRSLVALIKYIRGLSYRPGQTLYLNLTRRGYQHEWATFTFRNGKLPLIRPTAKRRG